MAGAPTKYDPNFIDTVDIYLQSCGREQTKLPTREGFARYINVHRDSLQEWCKSHKDFNQAMHKIEDEQKIQLIDDGMYGGKEVNAAMAIFLLKANHSMVETSRLEHTGKDGDAMKTQVEIIEDKNNSGS